MDASKSRIGRNRRDSNSDRDASNSREEGAQISNRRDSSRSRGKPERAGHSRDSSNSYNAIINRNASEADLHVLVCEEFVKNGGKN